MLEVIETNGIVFTEVWDIIDLCQFMHHYSLLRLQ